MVSKARLLLPEPERPVMTTSLSRGMVTSIFFKLCSRAPRMTILSCGILISALFRPRSRGRLVRQQGAEEKERQTYHRYYSYKQTDRNKAAILLEIKTNKRSIQQYNTVFSESRGTLCSLNQGVL